jgi:hypothetical protein
LPCAGPACTFTKLANSRITIGDGAFFKGGIDISKPGQQKDRIVGAEISANGAQTAA